MPFLGREVGDLRAEIVAGIVDDGLYRAEALAQGNRERGNVTLSRHVGDEGLGRAAGRPHLPRGLLERRGGAADRHDGRAKFAQDQRGGLADAAARARHHHRLAREFEPIEHAATLPSPRNAKQPPRPASREQTRNPWRSRTPPARDIAATGAVCQGWIGAEPGKTLEIVT